jgi:hypothetical protein
LGCARLARVINGPIRAIEIRQCPVDRVGDLLPTGIVRYESHPPAILLVPRKAQHISHDFSVHDEDFVETVEIAGYELARPQAAD